ncbi:lysozyme inhibitor LprI family protein [Labrys wisconsinensis]|uniref:Uncharacterized protein YecT (DUF1311 family) n=1 Tax=Labrys wisconsinensis TaxID=425677 RepID=A0ABU0JL99_9HYPH|nr:lysozyme inhibitor LprI family protein [Labrys wisconsinensis]MDQ0475071.1 uncharacterized protein YecT (DUF1311 family) [Labrys wisconsinensis]
MPRLVVLLALLALAPAARADDCADAADQRTMGECVGKSYQAADAELNSLYKRIQQRLKDDADTAKLLVAAQRSWVAFRDAECTFSSSGSAGGTIHPMVYAQCADGLTRKRIADLKAYLACGEGDMSCPVPAQ